MKRLLLVLALLIAASSISKSTAQAGWGKYGLYSRPYVVYPDGWGRKNYLLHYDYKNGRPIPGAQINARPYGF